MEVAVDEKPEPPSLDMNSTKRTKRSSSRSSISSSSSIGNCNSTTTTTSGPTPNNTRPKRSNAIVTTSNGLSQQPSHSTNGTKQKQPFDDEIENIHREPSSSSSSSVVKFDLGGSGSSNESQSNSSSSSVSSTASPSLTNPNAAIVSVNSKVVSLGGGGGAIGKKKTPNRHSLKALNSNPEVKLLKNIEEKEEIVNVDENTVDCFENRDNISKLIVSSTTTTATQIVDGSVVVVVGDEQESQNDIDVVEGESQSGCGGVMGEPLKEKKKRHRRTSLMLSFGNNLNAVHVSHVSQIFIYKWPPAESVVEGDNVSSAATSSSKNDDSDNAGDNDDDEKEKDRMNRIYMSNLSDLFCLQEQFSEYLGVKSFKRKYPDIFRRFIDIKEREYLKEHKVVSETQCDLGLTALNLNDCLDLMAEAYPEKYKEFTNFLEEKRRRAFADQAIKEKKRFTMTIQSDSNNKFENFETPNKRQTQPTVRSKPVLDQDRMKELIKKAIKSAAMYNSQFQKEKKEERQKYFDLQTMRLQCKTNPIKYDPANESTNKPSKGKYPVALLSGQYQYHYKTYTPEEKLYQPINTVICTRPTPLALLYAEWKKKQQHPEEDKHQKQSIHPHLNDINSHSMPTMQTSTLNTLINSVSRPVRLKNTSFKYQSSDDEVSNETSKPLLPKTHLVSSSSPYPTTTSKPIIRITASAAPTIAKIISSASRTCYICTKGSGLLAQNSTSTQIDQNQLLIQCSACPRSAHPMCLELNPQIVDWECIRAYDWQCMECKWCSRCEKTQDEDKMMFCDRCDRGFHTYCVGLEDVPSGSWLCTECVGWQERVKGLSEKYNEKKIGESPCKIATVVVEQQQPRIQAIPTNIQVQLKNKIMSSGRSVKRLSNHHEDGSKRGRGRPPGSLNKPKDPNSPRKTPKPKTPSTLSNITNDYSNSNGGLVSIENVFNRENTGDNENEYDNSFDYGYMPTSNLNGGLSQQLAYDDTSSSQHFQFG